MKISYVSYEAVRRLSLIHISCGNKTAQNTASADSDTAQVDTTAADTAAADTDVYKRQVSFSVCLFLCFECKVTKKFSA